MKENWAQSMQYLESKDSALSSTLPPPPSDEEIPGGSSNESGDLAASENDLPF
jgi:hypothetical protein